MSREEETAETGRTKETWKKIKLAWEWIRQAWGRTSAANTNKSLAVFTGVIAFATLLNMFLYWQQVGVMGRQLTTMEGQLDQMREIGQLDQRAWIGFSRGTHSQIKPDEETELLVQFVNTGKTPAHNIATHHTCSIRPADFDIGGHAKAHTDKSWDETSTKGPIPPNVGFMIRHSIPADLLTPAVVQQIQSGVQLVFVFGKITYSDVFGGDHETRFCHVVNPESTGMKPYHEYNYMD